MKMTRKTKMNIFAVIASAAVLTTTIAAVIANLPPRNPSDNPWDYSMYAFGEHNSLKSTANQLSVQGDIRTNGSINLNGESAFVSGFAIAGNGVLDGLQSFVFEKKIENAENIPHYNVFENIYEIAIENNNVIYQDKDISEQFFKLDSPVIAESKWKIEVSADIAPTVTEEPKKNGNKFGAFGADFLASVYEDPSRWNSVLPVFYPDTVLSQDDAGLRDLLELGANSNFIPVGEQAVSGKWGNYEKLPGTVFQDNFNHNYVPEYIKYLKEENESVFSVGQSDTVRMEAGYDNSMINPVEALNATSLTITGGSLALNGNYENLEEIRLDNWGGIQLLGNFPNLKYIYKTTWGNINLAGDFPALECVYMNGGQLLLGNGDKGFLSNNSTFINENGQIIIYTAKDVMLTNSSLVTNQNITVRGGGKSATKSKFYAENSLFAANNGLGFEDMNDNNSKRYEKLPVFYSNVPMSFVNCNIELMQGAFISKNGAMVLTESDIEIFRGFLFSPLGINKYASNSSVGIYLDTWSYNINPNINSLNLQQNGIWNIGNIGKMEVAEFPEELAKNIGNTENFIDDIQKIKNSDGGEDDKYIIGEQGCKPGAFILNSHLISDEDIEIDADYLYSGENSKPVIASRNGNIIINIGSEIDFNGIIYAPNGKVTINASGEISGRVFAQEIEIISDSLVIKNDGKDISYLGFTAPPKTDPTESSETVISDTEVSEDASFPEETIITTAETEIAPATSEETTAATVGETDISLDETTTTTSEEHSPAHSQAEYEYDNLGRLTKVIYDADNYIEYTYDANGNIKKVKTVKNGEIQ